MTKADVASGNQLTTKEWRCLLGEHSTATKKIRVASRTIAGPEGISQIEESKTPPTEQPTPMIAEYQVSVERL